MQALRAEHDRLGKLLAHLDQLADDLLEGRDVDYDLARRIALYCDEYVTELHHPLEELMIARLALRAPHSVGVVGPLLEQHQLLARETDALLHTTERLMTDVPIARTELADQVRRFVRHNLEHRDFEERELFPLAERTLTPADWDSLARFRSLEKRLDLAKPSHHRHADLEQLLR